MPAGGQEGEGALGEMVAVAPGQVTDPRAGHTSLLRGAQGISEDVAEPLVHRLSQPRRALRTRVSDPDISRDATAA